MNNLSFDSRHAWWPVPAAPGAEWTVEVFTVENAFGLDPAASRFDGSRLVCDGLQWLGGQRKFSGRVDVEVDEDADASCWRIIVRADEPVKGAKLLLRGLPADALASGWWTSTSAGSSMTHSTAEPVLLSYPWGGAQAGAHWQTPWAAAGSQRGVCLSVRDDQVRPVRLYVYESSFTTSAVVEICCDELATQRDQTYSSPEIRLRQFSSESEVAADFGAHLSHLENVHGLTPWAERVDVPAWVDEIELVLTLHGQHWTGHVFNTFDQMAATLREVCNDIPGSKVLAYLPGWEGRYYWQYPQYQPGEDLGGADGFTRLVQAAEDLGVHLMPMFGANGANVRRYPEWERSAFRSPGDRFVALVNEPDWDNDRRGEDDQVFLNVGEPAFADHLFTQIDQLVTRFGVEGVFLDTSACWFNDPHYEVTPGYRRLVDRLRAGHPGLLVCGEGWYDALLGIFPMNQTWIDIAEPPRFDDLPYRYARALGHLKDGAPGTGSTGVHEGGVQPVAVPRAIHGYVPALSLVDGSLEKYRDYVRDFVISVQRGEPSRADGRQPHPIAKGASA